MIVLDKVGGYAVFVYNYTFKNNVIKQGYILGSDGVDSWSNLIVQLEFIVFKNQCVYI